MKAQHIRLELAQDALAQDPPAPAGAASPSLPASAAPIASIRAVGWNLAQRAMDLRLDRGSLIDLAYRIRENDHPDFGGLEIEITGMQPSDV
jgi:hypothetical protein